MKNVSVSDHCIIAKFSGRQHQGDMVNAGEEAMQLAEKSGLRKELIDVSELKYADLSAALKLESIDALKLVSSTFGYIALVLSKDDEKLARYAEYALSATNKGKYIITTDHDEAIAWLQSKS